jgi:hypothetical protein
MKKLEKKLIRRLKEKMAEDTSLNSPSALSYSESSHRWGLQHK